MPVKRQGGQPYGDTSAVAMGPRSADFGPFRVVDGLRGRALDDAVGYECREVWRFRGVGHV